MQPEAPNPLPLRDPPSDELPDTVTVRPWRDPVVERVGFPVTSEYLEGVWLGLIGPSGTLALRRLGLWALGHPDGLEVDLAELAVDLGLSPRLGRNSQMARTIKRLELFGMIDRRGDELLVRTAVGPVPERKLRKLTDRAVTVHRRLDAERLEWCRRLDDRWRRPGNGGAGGERGRER